MKKVAIIGLGLMGGSLGLALRKSRAGVLVNGWARREETRLEALENKIVDEIFDRPGDAVRDTDLAVFCVPVLAIPQLIDQCKFSFPADCVVTDVGSTKAHIVREASRILDDVQAVFVGSHPIAGSEETGLEAARPGLYDGAVVVVTPADEQDTAATGIVREFWENLGSRVVMMRPEEHDGIIARTSHLPHLVTAMLVKSVFRDKPTEVGGFCGTGFLDATRIAGSSENIWHDIVKSNTAAVRWELDEFSKVLDTVRKMLLADDFEGIRRFLAEAGSQRRSMNKDNP